MKLHRLLWAALILLISCEEQFDVPLVSDETDLLAVEGLVTNERKRHVVKLSLPYGAQNGVSVPATGAAVYLFEDTTAFALTEFPTGSGNYYTPVMRGLVGETYTLYIQYEGRAFAAQDSPVPVQPLEELQYRRTDKGYVLVLNEQGQDPYYIEHNILWRDTEECVAGTSCDGRLFFYDLKNVDVNELYKPGEEPFYFPRNSIVIRRKYSVSPAYRAFLRSMLSETRWRGGAFDVQRSNVQTNLSEGGVGFFAVCNVVSDTTVVE